MRIRLLILAVCVTVGACSQQQARTLVYGRGGDSVGLDPALETDGESFKVCDNLYETLVTFSPGNTEVIPLLAERWEVSADRLTWSFHLRRGVAFHDGSSLDAQAVVFSLARQFVPDHPFHEVEGAYQYWSSMSMSDIVRAVHAVDDYTVAIELSRPNAPFLSNLAMNFCAIVSPTAVRRWGNDYPRHPVGTGPFRFVEWVKDDRIVLDANRDYWGAVPKLDRLIFRSIPENSVRLIELTQGSIDGMDNLVPDFIGNIQDDPKLQLLTQPGMNVGYLAMNMDRPPFHLLKVRQALNHAINKQALVDNLYQGLAVPAVNPIPPTMWSYHEGIEGYAYDPARARELLAEAGFPDGFETTLWAMPVPRPYMPQPLKIAQAIQADLSAVGIRAQIVTFEWGTYLDKVQRGQHDMALLGWTGDNGDPDNFLYVLLDKNATQHPANNIAFYRSEQLHEVLVQAQREIEIGRRTALYRRAQEVIHADAPWVPLVHAAQTAAFKATVRGFDLHPTGSKWFHNAEIVRPR
ncbi:MAG: ABC transporter substrate-binding protein [Candidatus Latescibacteria bacterium]|jgi:peptide/nickel transport system substrate-binding protein|nr:ABC transporter substrate-binding protein [Candidatus Latescibacterota bacterium]